MTSQYTPPAITLKHELVQSTDMDRRKSNPLGDTFKLTVSSHEVDRPTTGIVATESLIMHPPSYSDFFIDGKSAGEVDDVSILEDWLLHIDDLMDKAKTEPGLEVDDFDIAMLWIRKSTIFCTLGRYVEAKECAQKSRSIKESPMGLYRLACAQYCLNEFDSALSTLLEANDMDGSNKYIERALHVVIARMKSRKDRPDVKDEDEEDDDDFFNT
mmetsp:Transcript_25097/g.37002  ORF Transcript_25097/g.37002 Transcript_25097/m.37002 type:complete len:214 (+) Transcript_25097:93-734(+)|eukprot:CAMPEP_0185035432 /NCGR_PEP_ID=MMETSP1103-20130426/26785_1 /TAXON_ID=36769 /ORGANISM="Paraphysomonas bandaiensis, Strain Caron Lab Isolate" /LENGTH=213 /DNA_ID=CAMNT_0027572507 /DNA_START=6 /DNA_END=647 /DNA_ORIENTATION=+